MQPSPTSSQEPALHPAGAQWGKATPGQGCSSPSLPGAAGRPASLTTLFSVQDCNAHLSTGSVTLSKVSFGQEQTSHFYLSPPSFYIGSELSQEKEAQFEELP